MFHAIKLHVFVAGIVYYVRNLRHKMLIHDVKYIL